MARDATGCTDAMQYIQPQRAEALAADLVAREAVLLDQDDIQAGARQESRCDGTGGAGADDDDGSTRLHRITICTRKPTRWNAWALGEVDACSFDQVVGAISG